MISTALRNYVEFIVNHAPVGQKEVTSLLLIRAAVFKRRGPGISAAYYEHSPQRQKIEEK